MKQHYKKILAAMLAAMMLMNVGCAKRGEDESDKAGDTSTDSIYNTVGDASADTADVYTVADIPAQHRPAFSDPRAEASHGIALSATYTVPNGVMLSIDLLNGADQCRLKMSWQAVFEKYENGAWVKLAGQEEMDQSKMLEEMWFAVPYETVYSMPCFPEAGVYRCVLLCGGEVTAEHYAYFEVPAFTMTIPGEDEYPAADREDTPLNVSARNITKDGLTLVMTTRSGEKESITFGADYGISCHIDGEWKPVFGDSAFIALLYMREVDGECTLPCSFGKASSAMGSGHYRFEKVIDGVQYYVYFEIAD